jgi:hypothetical protein
MRDSGIDGYEWVPTCAGRNWYLLDRDGTVTAEVCRLPRELAGDEQGGGGHGWRTGQWSWLVRIDERCGSAITEADAFRQSERAVRAALARVA